MAIDMMAGRSKVKNLADWAVSWKRLNSIGDETLKANSTVYISNAEIEVQVQNGNVFFCGTDGMGSHARVYIENADFREELNFDNKEDKREQLILNDCKCKRILDYKGFDVFVKHLEENVVSNQEKSKMITYARKNKINEYDKVSFLEEYTGYKI